MGSYGRGRSELKVGLFALASVAVFILMFGGLTSRGVIRRTTDLYVLLPSAEGLLKGDAVLFRGVPVGEVREIAFTDSRGVLVRAKMRRAVPLSSDAAALLVPVDMFGRQSIVLRAGAGHGRPLAQGDTLVGQRSRPLTQRVEGLGRQVERFLADSTLVLLRDALSALGAAGSGLDVAGGEAASFLVDQRRNLDELTTAAVTLAEHLSAAADSTEMVPIRSALGRSAASLARATARMDSASALALGMMTKVERGEGSLGRLVNDPDLYARTTTTLLELERLVRDIRERPGRYITLKVF